MSSTSVYFRAGRPTIFGNITIVQQLPFQTHLVGLCCRKRVNHSARKQLTTFFLNLMTLLSSENLKKSSVKFLRLWFLRLLKKTFRFQRDKGFDKKIFGRQLSVMRGQIFNLREALRTKKSPYQLILVSCSCRRTCRL